jgi:hypothetical protein
MLEIKVEVKLFYDIGYVIEDMEDNGWNCEAEEELILTFTKQVTNL